MKKSKLVELLRANYLTRCHVDEIKPRDLVKTLTLCYLQSTCINYTSYSVRFGANTLKLRRNRSVTGQYIMENPKLVEKDNFSVLPIATYEVKGNLAKKRNEDQLYHLLGNYCNAFLHATLVVDPVFRRLVPTKKNEKLLGWEHLLFKWSRMKHGYKLIVYAISYHSTEYEVVPISYLLEDKFGEYIIV